MEQKEKSHFPAFFAPLSLVNDMVGLGFPNCQRAFCPDPRAETIAVNLMPVG